MKRRGFLKLGMAGFGTMALAGKSWALKYYPKPSPRKWAVVYGTWCGSSRDAGVWISEGMGGIADVYDVREDPDPGGLDHIVIGGSIRNATINPSMQRYIEKNGERLKGKIRGLYAVCWNGGKPPGPELKKAYIDRQLAHPLGAGNAPAKVFNGRITLGLLDKEALEVMKRMGVEDSDDLRRADCMAFGKEILAAMQ